MKAKIVRIGNSQGIRIPKPILEQTGLGEDVELEVVANQIIIRRADRPRSGWESAFSEMAESGADELLDGHISTEWENEEWTW